MGWATGNYSTPFFLLFFMFMFLYQRLTSSDFFDITNLNYTKGPNRRPCVVPVITFLTFDHYRFISDAKSMTIISQLKNDNCYHSTEVFYHYDPLTIVIPWKYKLLKLPHSRFHHLLIYKYLEKKRSEWSVWSERSEWSEWTRSVPSWSLRRYYHLTIYDLLSE